MAWGMLNPRYWPGRLKARHGDGEADGEDEGIGEAKVSPASLPLGAAGVGETEEEDVAATPAPLPEAPIGSGGADDAITRPPPAGGGAGAPSLADRPANAPSPTPTNDAAAKLAAAPAAAAMVPTIVNMVLPTSPRTTRLAMNGMSAIENEKMVAVSARRII